VVDGVSRLYIKSPEVLRTAREHYNCPTIERIEFENQGGVGSLGSHWERRIFGNEIMTSDNMYNPVLSAITMGFLKDTGWYDVDYDKAEIFLYGKNEGCEFLTEPCYSESGEPNFKQFCVP